MTDILPLILDELQALGVTSNYKGRKQASMAVFLVLDDEDRLEHITKEVYWEVADSFGCKRADVERNIRTVSNRAWKSGRKRLIQIARYELLAPPSASEFIAIVATHIRRSILYSNEN